MHCAVQSAESHRLCTNHDWPHVFTCAYRHYFLASTKSEALLVTNAQHSALPIHTALLASNDSMAELVFGVVTGGFAVASLAMQLVETAQKLYNFWDTLETSDSRIERIKDYLLLTQIISTSIVDICTKEPGIACGEAVTRSLDACKTRI